MTDNTSDTRRTAPAADPFRIRKYTPKLAKRYQYDDARYDALPEGPAQFSGFARKWGDGSYEVLDSKGRKVRAITVDGAGPGERAGGQEAEEAAADPAGIHPKARARVASMLEEERVAMETARELNRQGRADLAARFLEGYWRTHGGQAGGESALTITADGDAAREILAALRATRLPAAAAPGAGVRLGAYEGLGEKLMDKARETIVEPLVGPGEDPLELGDVGRVEVVQGPQRGPPAAPPPDPARRRAASD